jgi:CheY-like chemotaxis protein
MKVAVTPARILVVDDHQAHAEGLAELLALHGYQATFALTGKQALNAVADSVPDVVLTDLDIPDLSGYEICRRIRSNPEWENIVVIFHSGSEPSPDYDADYDAFLTYPMGTSDLVTVITGSILRRQRNRGMAQNKYRWQAGVPFS